MSERTSREVDFGISNSFLKRRQGNIRKILNQLTISGKIDNTVLRGTGVDLGSWIGTSTTVLKEYGGTIMAVEQAQSPILQGIRKGFYVPNEVYCGKGEDYLQASQDPLDFVTFFGASAAANLREISYLAIPRLKPNGFFLVTTIPELESTIDGLLPSGGEKLSLPIWYFWDAVKYLYTRSATG